MWCWRFQKDLTALADGELSAARAAAVRKHLDGCSACANLAAEICRNVREQKEVLPLLARGAAAADIDRLLNATRLRLATQRDEPAGGWLPRPALAFGGLAAGFALIAVSVWLQTSGTRAPAPNPIAIAPPPAAPEKRPAPRPPVVAQQERLKLHAEIAASPTPDEPIPADELPELVLQNPELFRDYRMFKRLDAMENFEDVLGFLQHKDPNG